MATATLSRPPVTLPGQPYRMSLDLYHRMGELGLLTPADRVVLLDGILVRKMTKGPRHTVAMENSSALLQAVLPAGWHVRHENPVTLPTGPAGAASEPEPDVAIARGARGDYAAGHPGPADCALVVEVADSSLADDRLGLARYAWAMIRCVWIVNLIDDVVEVYTQPSGPGGNPGYADRKIYGLADAIPVVIDGQPRGRIAVRDIIP